MDIRRLTALKEQHAGFRLLRAQNFPFIASFLWQTFPGANRRVIDAEILKALLDDFVFQEPDQAMAGPANIILQTWVDQGYLRQYYGETDDVARFEMTSALESVLDWVYSLQPRGFVGTESRLKSIFDLLEDLRRQTEPDIQLRVDLLQIERRRIEEEIDRTLKGEIKTLSDLQIRERFAQLEDMARQLLRDFSEVEHNFRGLDRRIRGRIARIDGSRGEVLTSVFHENDQIQQSDQGQSFASFYEFLMSAPRQEHFETLLDYLYKLESIQSTKPDPFLANLQTRLLDASDKVRGTQNHLSAMLRRFLDERNRLENSRINQLIHVIEQEYLDHKTELAASNFTAFLDDLYAEIDIPTRTLYKIPLALEKQARLEEANDRSVSAAALFAIDQVDDRVLRARIRRCLERKSPVTLEEVLQNFPVEKGMAELVAYMKIASENPKTDVMPDLSFEIELSTRDGIRRVAVPVILFQR
ncbi:MAG: DUF3375 domain-containing protein [Oligoflexus sp.]|nr:DUF3375 domain-containing protein [Oligoflexus sp.]